MSFVFQSENTSCPISAICYIETRYRKESIELDFRMQSPSFSDFIKTASFYRPADSTQPAPPEANQGSAGRITGKRGTRGANCSRSLLGVRKDPFVVSARDSQLESLVSSRNCQSEVLRSNSFLRCSLVFTLQKRLVTVFYKLADKHLVTVYIVCHLPQWYCLCHCL